MLALLLGRGCGGTAVTGVRVALGTAVALADVAQHAHLHRHDVELLADVLADFDHRRTARAGALGFGNRVNDVDTWQFGRQRLALAAAAVRGCGRRGSRDCRGQFNGITRLRRSGRFGFGLVKQPCLSRVRFATSVKLAQTGQPDLFVKL